MLGEAFLSKCAPQFKHRQDKAYVTEFMQPNLFSERDEVSSREYTCMLDNDADVSVGDTVILASGAGGLVVPTIMNMPVGSFDPSDHRALDTDLLAHPRCGGVALARVYSISPLGGAVIRLCE